MIAHTKTPTKFFQTSQYKPKVAKSLPQVSQRTSTIFSTIHFFYFLSFSFHQCDNISQAYSFH